MSEKVQPTDPSPSLKSGKPSKKQKNKAATELNTPATCTSAASGTLTEKELRKLEWEKKLTEQGATKKETKESLSKAELKAKRREQQEAQRLAKQPEKAPVKAPLKEQSQPSEKSSEKISDKSKCVQKTTKSALSDVKKSPKKSSDTRTTKSKVLSIGKSVQLVQHLYREPKSEYTSKLVNYKDVHPAFVRLGIQYQEKVILGSNARLLGLLAALKHLIDDIKTPPKQEYCRYLEGLLQNCSEYLQHCRPLAVSMTNALRQFKLELTEVDTTLSDSQKRVQLQDFIDCYIENQIKKAWESIIKKVNEKIVDGDVILIYSCSSIVQKILLEAHKNNKKFHVIVTDSRPLLEGREMLRRLVLSGIKCTYILINAISYIMGSVTKVLLGAHALLTNGYVMSRIGTAQVALVAQTHNKPVLVCCETYKFSEKVQTDSFVYNEIDTSDLLTPANKSLPTSVTTLKDTSKVNSLNLLYDVTPSDFISAVVTEIAILPCTSVPVVLRIHGNESI